MLKAYSVPAYILHRYPYGETSLLLDVFSKDYGRINLLAKGARKNKKQKSITFDLYQRYLVSWLAKTELGTLTEIDPDKNTIRLANKQVFCGFYMNELILYLLHRHEPHPDLFDTYEDTLQRLASGEAEEIVLRYFEKHLLQMLGYGLVLDVEVSTGEPISEKMNYVYEFEQGPLSKTSDSSGLRVSGKTLLQLDAETLTESQELREAKHLLRSMLARYLGNRKLQSRELYNAFIKAGTAG